MKESFVLHTDQKEPIFDLTIEQRGILLTAIYCYCSECDLPPMDAATKMAFGFIKKQIDYDNARYEEKRQKKVEAGKLGAKARIANQAPPSNVKQCQAMPSTVKHNDIGNDIDIGIDIENEEERERTGESGDAFVSTSPSKKFIPPTVEQVEEYCSKKGFQIDVRLFMDYYTANGWKVGKNPMRDWKAAVRTWENRARTGGGHISRGKTGGGIMEQMEQLYHAESDSLLPRGISSSEDDEGA